MFTRPEQQFRARKIERTELPPEAALHVAEQQHREQEFTRQFGHVRTPRAVVFNGYKLVVCGGGFISLPAQATKYFTDVLLHFIPSIFGREWFEDECTKPRGQRHPAMELRYRAMTYMNKQEKTSEGIYISPITGPMAGYFCFAYDLWVVSDTARLDKRLLERLKNRDQFQGARHELFAEATCIRAGFDIERENESDGSTRHAEFTATQRSTKQKVSVEAKSKHRPGILGQPGLREREGLHKMPIGNLLNDALAKRAPHPLVVFLDLNLPWKSAARRLSMQEPHPYIHRTMDRMRKRNGGKDPIPLLVITNHPEHYSEDEEIATSPQLLSMITNLSKTSDMLGQALTAIHFAANMYGRIPSHFEE
jgi:hypothetical protein